MDPLKLTCSQQLWLHSSVGRALHRYRRGHGFESHWSLNFFQASLSQLIVLLQNKSTNWKKQKLHVQHFFFPANHTGQTDKCFNTEIFWHEVKFGSCVYSTVLAVTGISINLWNLETNQCSFGFLIINMGLINKGWYGMFVACGLWCLADVLRVSLSRNVS